MPSKRVIRLPNGRTCGLAKYVASWRLTITLAAQNPNQEVSGWQWFSVPLSSVLRDLRDGMHDRINRHIAGYGKGRKWDGNWQRAAGNCARDVNTPRLVVRCVPAEFRARLAHRLTVD